MKLGRRQAAILRDVVATNGGGISAGTYCDLTPVRALERRGLIQGKAGEPYRIVHTREGLEWVRANPVKEAGE